MSIDLNDAPQQQGDLIPDGTVALLHATIRPGNAGPGGWLTPSKSSDALYLNFELTVLNGPHARRKVWQNVTLDGGKRNDRGASIGGEIGRALLRAILESSRGVRPDDESATAKQARQVPDLGAFNGMEFVGRIGVEEGRNGYKPRNRLDAAVTPDKPEWSQATGRPAPASPQGAQAQPAWGGSQQPAAQQPAQASAPPPQAQPAGQMPAWLSR